MLHVDGRPFAKLQRADFYAGKEGSCHLFPARKFECCSLCFLEGPALRRNQKNLGQYTEKNIIFFKKFLGPLSTLNTGSANAHTSQAGVAHIHGSTVHVFSLAIVEWCLWKHGQSGLWPSNFFFIFFLKILYFFKIYMSIYNGLRPK